MNVVELKESAVRNAAADPRRAALATALGVAASDCRFVGGTVRDWALGRDPLELDVVVDGDARDLAELVAGKDARLHHRFMTAEVDFDFGRVDFASARSESYPESGALPEVEPASADVDLRRRDFSINALTMSVDGSEAGGLDLGWSDLADSLLRVLHAQSFNDDPTRLWRLARYRGRLGFEIEPETSALARSAVSEGSLAVVSAHRIGVELLRTSADGEPDEALLAAIDMGLAGERTSHGLVAERVASARSACEGSVPDSRLRIAALGSACDWPEHPASELELGSERQRCFEQGREISRLHEALAAAARPSEIVSACRGWEPAAVAVSAALGFGDEVALWFGELKDLVLPFDGSALLAAGVGEGPALGVGLNAALDAMCDRGIKEKADLLEIAIAAASGGD